MTEPFLARLAARFTSWAERWIPDAYVFALLATLVVVLAGLVVKAPEEGVVSAAALIVRAWGDGFWDLLSFTLQMALIIISGSVVASTGPVGRAIEWLARRPTGPRGAVAFVALVGMASSWVNWGFGLIFTAMLARAVARRVPDVDYRALGASVFLGLGSVWAQGLSGSAALQMATATALPPAIRSIVEGGGAVPGGLIPLRHTIFLWQSLFSVVVEMVVVTALMYFAAPGPGRGTTAAMLGVDLSVPPSAERPASTSPGEWLEHRPHLTVVFTVLAGGALALTLTRAPDVLSAITLNTLNLFFLTVGVALHGTPGRLMRAFREATPAVWAVVLQFPLYAAIASVIVKTGLNERIAGLFVSVSTPSSYPALVALYSAVLGVFVPSGGSKWIIEAPYVMEAAHQLKVHLGWMVAVYDLGEALANLIQPFWMVPVLGLLGLRARDVMGYTALVFLVLTPLVLVLVTVLGATLPYPL